MFHLFSFVCVFSAIARTSFITATFSQPTSSTQWIHLRELVLICGVNKLRILLGICIMRLSNLEKTC